MENKMRSNPRSRIIQEDMCMDVSGRFMDNKEKIEKKIIRLMEGQE
jgi:hypothetical protein